MTFSQNIEDEKGQDYLCTLFPSIRITVNQLDAEPSVGTGIYSYMKSFPANFAQSVSYNSTSFTSVSSLSDLSSPSANRYFFDISNSKIYFDLTSKSLLDDDFLVVDYQMNFASKEFIHYSDPLNSSSDLTTYRPNLLSTFNIDKSIDNQINGFMPSISSSVSLINVDYSISFMFGRSTLSRKQINIYIMSGDRTVENTYYLFNGTVSSVSFDDSTIAISVIDNIFKFESQYEYGSGFDIYTSNNFTRLDPSKEGQYIKTCFGVVNNVECTNISYDPPDSVSYGVSNIKYSVAKHYGNTTDDLRQYIIQAGSTSTNAVFDTVDGLNIGDELWISNTTPSASNSFRITNINRSTKEVSAVSGIVTTPGTIYNRDRVGYIYLLNKETGARTSLNRAQTSQFSFSTEYDTTNKYLFVNTSFNADVFNLVGTNNPTVMVRLYGEVSTAGITGESFNEYSFFGNTSKWYQILYELLRNSVGFSESQINTDTFLSFESDRHAEEDIGFYIPFSVDSLPTNKEIITKILKSVSASIYLNSDQKIDVYKTSKMSGYDHLITKDDFYSISVSESYEDLVSKVTIGYKISDYAGGYVFDLSEPLDYLSLAFKEISSLPGKLTDTFQNSFVSDLYGVRSELVIDTGLYVKDQASEFAEKTFTIYSYPKTYLTISLPITYIGVNIGDIVRIDHDKLFGFLDGAEIKSLYARVIGYRFSNNSVVLTLWTQQGIQDSSGVW